MKTENDVYEHALCEHLQVIAYRLRHMPADKWDWSPAVCAPSPKMIGQHAWAWLWCDRQHINEPDCSKHERVPDPPAGQEALCEAIEEETGHWRRLLRELTPEQLAEPRLQFGSMAVSVRWFIYHMLQHIIYKSGQLAEVYFALGLDGEGPYTAPWPNAIYEAIDESRRDPFQRAMLDRDLAGLESAVAAGADPNAPDSEGDRPLFRAACMGSPEMVALLLRLGTDPAGTDARGHTADEWSDYLGFPEISEMIRAARTQ